MASTPKETTTKTEPWDGAKPYIEKYLAQADKLYDQGKPNYYPDQTYADQSKATLDAQKLTEQKARQGTALYGNAQNAANNVMTGGASNTQAQNTLAGLQGGIFGNGTGGSMQAPVGTGGSMQLPKNATTSSVTANATGGGASTVNPAAGTVGGIANGSLVGTAPGQQTLTQGQNFQNAAFGLQQGQANNLSGANNPAMDMLQKTANGDFINNNPYLNQAITNANAPLIEQFKTQISPGLDSKAALAGRTGSGAASFMRNDAESTLANAMSKNASDIAYQNYGNERSNQLNAQNSIGNFYNTDVGNSLSANQALAGTSGQQQGQRMDAANSVNGQYNSDRGLQMQGLGLQSDIYNSGIQNQFQDANLKLNAANSAFQNQNTAANTQLQAAGMADYLRGLDFADADRLAGVGAQQDAWNNMVKQSDIARHDYENNQPFNNIANMINMANGGGYNNQTTPVYSNTAGQVGGLLTGLLGLFTSDIKTKKILSRVGITPNGIPMYQFVYHDDPEQQIFVGPIAQEMQKIKPDAVIDIDGILHVDSGAFSEEPTWH